MNENSREGSAAVSRVLSGSDLQKELAEVLQQRAAISAVLRAISNSPHDLSPYCNPSSTTQYTCVEQSSVGSVLLKKRAFVSLRIK